MVTTEDNANRKLIETKEVFDPSPSDFLPSDAVVKLTFHTKTKGFDVSGNKWHNHKNVYSIFTDSNLYIVSADKPADEYLKIPYGTVSSYSHSTPTFRNYQVIEFDAGSDSHTLYLKSSVGEKAVEKAMDLLSLEQPNQIISEGKIQDLYMTSRQKELDAEYVDDFYYAEYNFDESGDTLESNNIFHNAQNDARETMFKTDRIEIRGRNSINYSDIVGMIETRVVLNTYEIEDTIQGSAVDGACILTEQGTIIHIGYLTDINASKSWPDELTDFVVSKSKIRHPNELDAHAEIVSDKPGKIKHIFVNPFSHSLDPELKVENWTTGDEQINASIDAESKSKGKSSGIEVGPFNRGKSKSEGSISGEISGEIKDNTFTAPIRACFSYNDRIVVDSGVKLELLYSEIKRVSIKYHEFREGTRQSVGFIVETDNNSYHIDTGTFISLDSEKIEEIQGEVEERKSGQGSAHSTTTKSTGDGNSNDEPTEKLMDLKKLLEEDVITESEFEEKKSEILKEF